MVNVNVRKNEELLTPREGADEFRHAVQGQGGSSC